MARQLKAIPSTESWLSDAVEGATGAAVGRGGRGREDLAGECVVVGGGREGVVGGGRRGVALLEALGIITVG